MLNMILPLLILSLLLFVSPTDGDTLEQTRITVHLPSSALSGNNTGEMGCIGVQITNHRISEIYYDSPAWRAGFQLQDLVIAINGQSTSNWDDVTICTHLLGDIGSSAVVTTQSFFNGQISTRTVNRYPLSQVPSQFMPSLRLTLDALPH